MVVMLGLVGCVTVPRGPQVAVFVGQGKTLTDFQRDDAYCRSYAEHGLGQTATDAQVQGAATGAAVTGLLGAGLGAAIGAVTGSPGLGAAVGGAAGVMTGAAGGARQGERAALTLQQQYDRAYALCVDSLGHRVAGAPVR
jgi:hypothetical protein